MLLNKNKLDISQIFLVFVALVGDVYKTAAALNLDPELVQKLVDSEGWATKIQRVTLMSKSGRPGDYEKAVNRALAFVQGHRIRSLIDRVITRFSDMTEAEICHEITAVGKNGIRHVSARFFTDLAAAAEKANALTFTALGDTATDRAQSEPDELNASALHAAVIASLNAPGNVTKSADVIVRELAAEVAQLSEPSSSAPANDNPV